MTEVTSKAKLIEMLKISNRQVIAWFTPIAVEEFFLRRGEDWSASENVEHLIRAHTPLTQALKLPRLALRMMFGKPQRASLTYEEICKAYRDEISKGAQASGRYLPSQGHPNSSSEKKKRALLDQFSKVSTELVSVIETWHENEVEQYVLPHPILGKLTVREMVFFTVYHNLRHASQEGD